MGLTDSRKADIAYKLFKGVAPTGTSRASYEESHPFLARVVPSQIWKEASDIPSAPTAGMVDEEVDGVVQRRIDLVLTQELSSGTIISFYSDDLKDAIDPERYGEDWAYELKQNDDTVIPPGYGNYEVNPEAGVVTFDEGTTIDSTPIKISFYKYVGEKGLQTSQTEEELRDTLSSGGNVTFTVGDATVDKVVRIFYSAERGGDEIETGNIIVTYLDDTKIGRISSMDTLGMTMEKLLTGDDIQVKVTDNSATGNIDIIFSITTQLITQS